MVSFNGITTAVHVDGQPLQEFQTDIKDAEKTASCWIPSCVGKEFAIHVRNTTSTNPMTFDVELDGVFTNKHRLKPGGESCVDKCRPSPTTYRYFTFSQGRLVEDEELPTHSSNMACLGTITITVFFAKLVKRKKKTLFSDFVKIDIPDQRSIPEREKKGIQECIGLGRIEHRVTNTQPSSRTAQRLGIAAKFTFRYRSLAYLEAQGIAPSVPPPQQEFTVKSKKRKNAPGAESSTRPPKMLKTSAERAEAKRLIEISDEEDVEKLTALRARIDKALQKKGVQTTQIKMEVKTEPRSALGGTQIIDLT